MGYSRFKIGCVFIEYDMFKPTTFIQNSIYMNFRMNLTLHFFCRFLETGTSNKCLICIVLCLRFSGFILYPFSFFLYIPINLLTFHWLIAVFNCINRLIDHFINQFHCSFFQFIFQFHWSIPLINFIDQFQDAEEV